jgi:hypothetical protein
MKRSTILVFLLVSLLPISKALAVQQSICWNSGIPSGWIQVDFYTSYSTCGNGGFGNPIQNNVWVIDSYYDKAIGSSMSVCGLQATPSGWETLRFETTGSQCYYGSSVPSNNIKIIRRVR